MRTKLVILCLVGTLIIVSATTESVAQVRGTRTRGLSRSSGVSARRSSRASSPSIRSGARSTPASRPAAVSMRSAPRAPSVAPRPSRSAPSRMPSTPRSVGRSVNSFRSGVRSSVPSRPSRPSVSVTRPTAPRASRVLRGRRSSSLSEVTVPQPTIPNVPSVSVGRRPQPVARRSGVTPPQPAEPVRPPTVQRPSVNTSMTRPRSTTVTQDTRTRTTRTVAGNQSRARPQRLRVFGSTRDGTEPAARSIGERLSADTDARKVTSRSLVAEDLSKERSTRADEIYPRRSSREDSGSREPRVIGSRPHRSTPFPRTLRPDASDEGVSPARARQPALARDAGQRNRPERRERPRAGERPRTVRWPSYQRQIRLARRSWVRSLRHRHHDWWISFGFNWGTPYVWEPYWYPYRPYIGRWHGYDSWYHCTPFTVGVSWPWHYRVRLGYVYTPHTYYAPYSASVWLGYDPFLYFWWPAPYNVSVNYYTYENTSYPPDSVRDWSSNDWVYYEPSAELPAQIETPLSTPTYVAGESYVSEPVQEPYYVEPLEAETVPVEEIEEPIVERESTPAGVVEAATVSSETPVEVEPEPLAVQEPAAPAAVAAQVAPPPVKRSIAVPAPGRSKTTQTTLAAGGLAFLGAALWMAWPRP